jgi:hypothetical protein
MATMLRGLAHILCLVTLLAGPGALRSLHELSHGDHANLAGATSRENAVLHGTSSVFAGDDGDTNDAVDHAAPSHAHQCGLCDELAAATNDRGLNFQPLHLTTVDRPDSLACPVTPCILESPRVALANPPPVI